MNLRWKNINALVWNWMPDTFQGGQFRIVSGYSPSGPGWKRVIRWSTVRRQKDCRLPEKGMWRNDSDRLPETVHLDDQGRVEAMDMLLLAEID